MSWSWVGFGIEVAGKLVLDEVVIGQVLVEGPDHPISVRCHFAIMVMVNAVGVGEAHQVEPVLGHVFAVLWLGQQAIDQALVGVRRGVGEKGLDFLAGRRQTGKIEAQAPDQSATVCGRTRCQAFRLESAQDESIDRLLAPALVVNVGQGRFSRRDECPEIRVCRSFFDPVFNDLFLAGGQRFLGESGGGITSSSSVVIRYQTDCLRVTPV